MPDVGLLTPGADLAPGSPAAVTDDVALLRAMLRVEAAWVHVLVRRGVAADIQRAASSIGAAHVGRAAPGSAAAGPTGVLPTGDDEAIDGSGAVDLTETYPEDIVEIPDAHAHDTADIAAVVDSAVERLAGPDGEALALASRLARESGAGGNPVIPLVGALRAAVGPQIAPVVHAGLTSQDVLDTALVLLLRDAAHAVVEDLDQAAVAAARLAAEHRGRPALARTLAQAAVPTTLGARFAGWLQGILAARGFLSSVADALPLAYGGAAGELSGVAALAGGAGGELALIEAWGAELGLPVGPGPWHATRTPVVRLGSALAETCAALGKVANDVLQAVRPGVGELREPSGPGRGTSSAMAHKHNPVLSVLVRRSAIAAPHLAAQVLAAAGLAVDERSDGAWHAEWPALQQLARHAVASAHVATELLDGLEVDADAVARNLHDGLPDAGSGPDVAPAAAVVDRVLEQFAAQTGPARSGPAVGRA
ncbi:lyase family protein [Promicromonospora kroppenstedtii]|uniref:Lyase family protein n=1 Tax=Promicromonospora kroppenstedtii TaxID=440482 RepID=A0ABW7XQ30_9MICO